MKSGSGNVVLVEAFIVLSLVFMIQFVLSATATQSREVEEKNIFNATFRQLETRGNAANHFRFLVIDEFVILMGGKDNCHEGHIANPEAFPNFDISSSVIIGNQRPDNKFEISSDETALLISHLEEKGIFIQFSPDTVGQKISITGDLNIIEDKEVEISAIMCVCYLSAPSNDPLIGIEHPHPLAVELFTYRNGHAEMVEAFGYHHDRARTQSNLEGGLISADTDGHAYIDPFRQFKVSFDRSGRYSLENLRSLENGS